MKVEYIKNKDGERIYPVAHANAILTDDVNKKTLADNVAAWEAQVAANKTLVEKNKADFDNLNAQFQTAVSAVTVDSEVQNIRVKADGTTATSAGDAVREQVSELKSDLRNNINDIYGTSLMFTQKEWIEGEYVKKTGGAIATDEGWHRSDFIEIPEGVASIHLTSEHSKHSTWLQNNGLYDKDKNWISNIELEKDVPILSNYKYLMISVEKSYDVNVKYEPIDSILKLKEGIRYMNKIGGWINNKYIGRDGKINNASGWKASDFIEIPKNATKIYVECSDTSETAKTYNSFYDKSQTFASFLGLNEWSTIPYNAKYIRVSGLLESDFAIKYSTQPIDVIEFNRDVENIMLQSTAKRSQQFGDTKKPITFLHFTDLHGVKDNYKHIIEYLNYYAPNIDAIIHTGDFVYKGQADFEDLFSEYEVPKKIFQNIVGNHDQYVSDADRSQASINNTYTNVVSSFQKSWLPSNFKMGTFMPVEGSVSMSYYRDYTSRGIRMIFLDNYYNQEAQLIWLENLLNDAITKGLHVITFAHEKTGHISSKISSFNDVDNYDTKEMTSDIERVIKNAIDNGLVYIAHICGHEHIDGMGFTSTAGILNITVECATSDTYWQNVKREQGTKTFDCFNIVTIDAQKGHLKIVRIGDNSTRYLKSKKSVCYDYINKKVIAENGE